MKSIIKILGTLFSNAIYILKTDFKWMFGILLLWVYRVVALSADSAGFAKGLQVVCIIGLFYYARKLTRCSLTSPYREGNAPMKWMIAYFILGLISTAWSYNPQFSSFLSLEKLVFVFLIYALFTLFDDLKELERFIVMGFLGIMLYEVIIWRIFKEQSLFTHVLTTASCAAILFAYCIGELLAKRVNDPLRDKMLRSALILSLVVLVISTSGGANGSAALALGIAMIVSGKLVWGALVCFGGGVLYLQQDLADRLMTFLMPGKSERQIETLTGRDNIWKWIEYYGSQKPMCGWGYACIERVISDRHFALTDAHNNYYGAWGGTGYIGLFLLIGNHISQIFIGLKKRLQFGYSGLLCATCAAALNGYTYGFLSGKGCTITLFYITIMVATLRYSQLSVYDGESIE